MQTPNVQVASGIIHATKIAEWAPPGERQVLLCRPRARVITLVKASLTTDTVTCQHCAAKSKAASVATASVKARATTDTAPNGDTWDTYRNRMLALGYAHARIELTPETSRQDTPGPEAFADAYAQAINDYNAAHPYPTRWPNLSEAWQDYSETGKIN